MKENFYQVQKDKAKNNNLLTLKIGQLTLLKQYLQSNTTSGDFS